MEKSSVYILVYEVHLLCIKKSKCVWLDYGNLDLEKMFCGAPDDNQSSRYLLFRLVSKFSHKLHHLLFSGHGPHRIKFSFDQ